MCSIICSDEREAFGTTGKECVRLGPTTQSYLIHRGCSFRCRLPTYDINHVLTNHPLDVHLLHALCVAGVNTRRCVAGVIHQTLRCGNCTKGAALQELYTRRCVAGTTKAAALRELYTRRCIAGAVLQALRCGSCTPVSPEGCVLGSHCRGRRLLALISIYLLLKSWQLGRWRYVCVYIYLFILALLWFSEQL